MPEIDELTESCLIGKDMSCGCIDKYCTECQWYPKPVTRNP
jgi:hypothetical protein